MKPDHWFIYKINGVIEFNRTTREDGELLGYMVNGEYKSHEALVRARELAYTDAILECFGVVRR